MQKILRWKRGAPKGDEKEPSVPIVEYLRRVHILADLSQEEIEQIFQGTMLRECKPGTVFFTPDDPSERLFVLKRGLVEVYRLTAGGKRLLTRRIGPGTIFGEVGLLGQTMQGCFAEAKEESLVCTATREDILRLLKERPEVAVRLLEVMGKQIRLLEERLEHTAFSPLRVRLARFLLANADYNGVLAGYTHADIGDTVGALRQTVTETLSQMQNEGLVEVGHKQVRITSRQGLEALAKKEDEA